MSAPTEPGNGPGSPPAAPAPAGADDFATWNESMVERYDIERYYERAHPLVRWLERRRLAALLDLASPRPGERVLEVGCGAGHVLERFEGTTRTGVDLSAGMIARARRRLGGAARLARAAGERLPFSAGAFDIEHVPDPAAVLAELVRVTRPDGRVVVSIPNEGNIDRVKRAMGRLPVVRGLLRRLAGEGNEWHLHSFDLALLRHVVEGRARIVRLRAIPGGVLPLRYVALLRADDVDRRSRA